MVEYDNASVKLYAYQSNDLGPFCYVLECTRFSQQKKMVALESKERKDMQFISCLITYLSKRIHVHDYCCVPFVLGGGIRP